MSRRIKGKTAAGKPQAKSSGSSSPAAAQSRADRIGRSSGADKAIAMVVATPQGPRRIQATSREVNEAQASAQSTRTRSVTGSDKYATVGSMTAVKDGQIIDDVGMYNKIRLAKAMNSGGLGKTAMLFEG